MKLFSPFKRIVANTGMGACPVLEQLARQATKRTCVDASGRPIKCKK